MCRILPIDYNNTYLIYGLVRFVLQYKEAPSLYRPIICIYNGYILHSDIGLSALLNKARKEPFAFALTFFPVPFNKYAHFCQYTILSTPTSSLLFLV